MQKLIQGKGTPFTPSAQVIAILHDKGLSKIFNYSDYEYFKRLCKGAFNLPMAIVDLFIQYNTEIVSDYEEYIF
ncbi:hypothetical protein [Flavobacterium rhizosphaerae]|uniref:Uncharacterized protein n=1 Tax=Flavobacterium rhizosphaerae TaxID=3163298 RepID=A0ABW8YWR4_9FLAO